MTLWAVFQQCNNSKHPASGFNTGVSFGQPTMIMTQDCLLKIWGFKSSTRKQIEITHETIEQIALTV